MKKDQVYGLDGLTKEEEEKVVEDGILLWRSIFLFMIASYVNQAMGLDRKVGFILEQLASPKSYMPEVVSLWDQEDWKKRLEKNSIWNN